ncbi:MAG: CDP-alcohol phosphatidyltransferase family protein [Candidatus Zhuqueibacterota bacterium]
MDNQNQHRIFTVPNLLSLIRIFLIAPIAILVWYDDLKLALILTVIAMATDFFDGKIARHFHQTSDLGKILDPIADKLSCATLLIVLLLKDKVPLWVVVLIIGRDVIISIAGVFLVKKYRIVTTSNLIGKLTATSIAFMIVSYIFDLLMLEKIFLPLTVFMVFLSGFSYLKRFIYIQISDKQ